MLWTWKRCLVGCLVSLGGCLRLADLHHVRQHAVVERGCLVLCTKAVLKGTPLNAEQILLRPERLCSN